MGQPGPVARPAAWISSAQPSCPDLASEGAGQQGGALGGTVTVKATVRNVGATIRMSRLIMSFRTTAGVTIGITLPDAMWSPLRVVATAVKLHKGLTVAAKYQSPGVYWLPLSLPAGKGAQVLVKARVAACPALVGTEMAFAGVVYKVNATDQVLCATAATGRHMSTKVKPAKSRTKTLPPSACSSPTPAPTTPPPQGYQAVSFGSTGADQGYGIAVDASGSSYMTGYFSGTMTVGSTTLTPVDNQDIFVIKLNASGSPVP